MKSFIALVAFFSLIVSAISSPIKSADSIAPAALPEDWQLIPDGNGNLYMVDVNAYQPELQPLFNAWTDVIVTLFTRNNPTDGQIIQLYDDGQLSASNFNPSHQTRFVSHGWNNDGSSDVNILIRNAYLAHGDFNVFIIDWGAGAQTINYIAARQRVPDMGVFGGEYVDWLNSHGLPFNYITCVGHSLGAHIAGHIGKSVTRGVIQNVVALDPAMPLFTLADTAGRVHYTDAIFVQIIHTDVGRLGFYEPLGDVSFYPNYGWSQPGCGWDLTGSCGHSRAFEFFAESITSTVGFWGDQCGSFAEIQNSNCQPTNVMGRMGGEPLHYSTTGVFHVPTNAASPFALG